MPALIVLKISLSQTVIAQPPYIPVLDLARRLAGLARFRRAAVVRQLRGCSARTRSTCSSYLRQPRDRGAVDGDPALDRLSDGLRHRARTARAAADPGDGGDSAVLDGVPDPHLCLDQHPAARRLAQRRADGAWHHRRAGGRGLRPTRPSISASSIPICRSWCCRSMRASRRWTRRCSRPPRTRAARSWKAFWLVTVPLSAPGVMAGALLCFIPIVGEFVIPDLLGGSSTLMIGQTLWTEFFRQSRLAGGFGGGDRAAGDPAGADPDLSALADACIRGIADAQGPVTASMSRRSRSGLPFSICRSRSW